MAKILCVLYDDPVDGYPPAYARDEIPADRALSRRPDHADPGGDRLHPRRAARQRLRRARAAQVPRGAGPRAGRHLRQGRPRLGVRARAARRRGRHLPALLAGLPDRRADRQGAEPEAGDHRRHRLRPRRPAGRDRPRHHGRRGDLLQQHQRRRARRDDDPRAGPQLHPLLPDRGRRRLEHRRLRRHARTTSRACRSAPSPPGASARAVLRRLKPFDVGLHYTDRHRLPDRGRGGARRDLPRRAPRRWSRICDVVTINAPLHPETEHLFDDEMLAQDEARRLPRQHRPRQDLRPRRDRARARERAARRLRRRRLVPAAGAAGPPVADDAPPRHDPAHLRHEPLGAGPLRGRHARDPRVLLRAARRSATST